MNFAPGRQSGGIPWALGQSFRHDPRPPGSWVHVVKGFFTLYNFRMPKINAKPNFCHQPAVACLSGLPSLRQPPPHPPRLSPLCPSASDICHASRLTPHASRITPLPLFHFYGDLPIVFEHRKMHIGQARATGIAQRRVQFMMGNLLALHHRFKQFAIMDENLRTPFNQ